MSTLIRNAAVFRNNSIVENQNIVIDGKYIKEFPDNPDPADYDDSLTMLLPSALGFSPHPPVSVYGTGAIQTIAAFLDAWLTLFPTLSSVRITSSDCRTDLPVRLLPCLRRAFHSRLVLSTRVPTVLLYRGTGMSTCCPSVTSFDLALGPDLPRACLLYTSRCV